MGKKIEGFITGRNNGPGYELGDGKGYCDFWEGKERKFGVAADANRATLILHEGAPEKVFTESEVKKIIERLACETYSLKDWRTGHGKRILEREFGITL